VVPLLGQIGRAPAAQNTATDAEEVARLSNTMKATIGHCKR
jgi:hypothetical protein